MIGETLLAAGCLTGWMRLLVQSVVGGAAVLQGLVCAQTNDVSHPYPVIIKRNVFGLRKMEAVSQTVAEPKEELRLTGLMQDGNHRKALFAAGETNGPNRSFSIPKGGQNDWLAVKSVSLREGLANVVLKRAANRMRTIGVEVPLLLGNDSLETAPSQPTELPAR